MLNCNPDGKYTHQDPYGYYIYRDPEWGYYVYRDPPDDDEDQE